NGHDDHHGDEADDQAAAGRLRPLDGQPVRDLLRRDLIGTGHIHDGLLLLLALGFVFYAARPATAVGPLGSRLADASPVREGAASASSTPWLCYFFIAPAMAAAAIPGPPLQ